MMMKNAKKIKWLHTIMPKLKDIARELINKDNMQPIQFLDYLNIMITSGQDEDEADVAEIERERGIIRVYSIHKAKGLSFPIVIVPCIDTKLNRPITKPKIIFDSKKDRCKIGFNNKELSDDIKTDKDYIDLLEEKTVEQLEEELRVAESLDCVVSWDQETETATFTRPLQTKRLIVFSGNVNKENAVASVQGDGFTILQFDKISDAADYIDKYGNAIKIEPDQIQTIDSLSWGVSKIGSERYYNQVSVCAGKATVAVIDTGIDDEDKIRTDAFRDRARCTVCGSRMAKLHCGGGVRKRTYWKCSNDDCIGNKHVLNEKDLSSAVADILNDISDNLEAIRVDIYRNFDKDESIVYAENELNEIMERKDAEASEVVGKMLELASIKFDRCLHGDYSAVTKEIEKCMAVYTHKDVPDGKTIKNVIKTIKISPYKTVTVELINGKEFTKEKVSKWYRVTEDSEWVQ